MFTQIKESTLYYISNNVNQKYDLISLRLVLDLSKNIRQFRFNKMKGTFKDVSSVGWRYAKNSCDMQRNFDLNNIFNTLYVRKYYFGTF